MVSGCPPDSRGPMDFEGALLHSLGQISVSCKFSSTLLIYFFCSIFPDSARDLIRPLNSGPPFKLTSSFEAAADWKGGRAGSEGSPLFLFSLAVGEPTVTLTISRICISKVSALERSQ